MRVSQNTLPWLAAFLLGASLLLLSYAFNAVPPPLQPSGETFNEQQSAVVQRLSEIVDRSIAIAIGLAGLTGSALLGVERAPTLERRNIVAACVALYLFVVSAASGGFVRIRIVEFLMMNEVALLDADRVQIPLRVQLLSLIAGFAAIAWIAASKALDRLAKAE